MKSYHAVPLVVIFFFDIFFFGISFCLAENTAQDQPEAIQKKATSISDLLPFAEPKYNRAQTSKETRVYASQQRPSNTENTRLKEAILSIEKAKNKDERHTQCLIIIWELSNNSLVPDVAEILHNLPESDQINLIQACIVNGQILKQAHANQPGIADWSLLGTGILRKMQIDIFQAAILRRDLKTVESVSGERALAEEGIIQLMQISISGLKKIFEKNPNMISMDEYFDYQEANWGNVRQSFSKGMYSSTEGSLSLSEKWVYDSPEAMIAFQEAMFGDYDSALKRIGKIENTEHRLLLIFAMAQMKAYFGDLEGAVKMWENFPDEMFEPSFSDKVIGKILDRNIPEDEFPRLRKTRFLNKLIYLQIVGGIKSAPIPSESVLHLVRENETDFKLALLKSLYANGHIKEMYSLLEKIKFPEPGSQSLYGSPDESAVHFLCDLANNAKILGENERASELLSKAFEFMRKQEGERKFRQMMAIADRRYKSQMYDFPFAFSREELDLLTVDQTSGLPWFMRNEEEEITRTKELTAINTELPKPKNPFFAAAMEWALSCDNMTAVGMAVKGMAVYGEKEVAREYVQPLMEWNTPKVPAEDSWRLERKQESLAQLAQAIMFLDLEPESLAETFNKMQKMNTRGREFLFVGQMREIANFAAKMGKSEFLIKALDLCDDKKMAEETKKTLNAAKIEYAQFEERKRLYESGQWNPPPLRANPLAELKPEEKFDGYANEVGELHGWRRPLALLMKKMPTAKEAYEVVRKARLDNDKKNNSEELEVGAIQIDANETASAALKRLHDTLNKNENLKKEPQRMQNALDAGLRSIALQFIRFGYWDRAQSIMAEIKHPAPKAEVLLTLAVRRYDQAETPEDLKKAEKLFDQFEEHQASYGNPVKPSQNLAQDSENSMNRYYRDEYYCAYIIRLAQRGLMERALKNEKKIETAFEKAEAIYTIAMKYALLGDFERAILTARHIRDAGTGSYTRWNSIHADGIGPYYSKLQTITSILDMANKAKKEAGAEFEIMSFIDSLEEKEAKIDLILSYVSQNYSTELVIGRSFLGMPYQTPLELARVGEKPLLRDSEEGKLLLARAFGYTKEIEKAELRDSFLLQILPFLVSARMAGLSFEAAKLIDTEKSFGETQKVSEHSYNTRIPSHIFSVISLLIEQEQPENALFLCDKIIAWVQDMKYVGKEGGIWPNVPNDTRNRIICIAAELQAKAGFHEKAIQTLAAEHATIETQGQKSIFFRRIAESQFTVGEKELAEKTYTEAIKTSLGSWPDMTWTGYNDQKKWFGETIDSYMERFSNSGEKAK